MFTTPHHNLTTCPCPICFYCCCGNPACVNRDSRHPENICDCTRSEDIISGSETWGLLDLCECGSKAHFIIKLKNEPQQVMVKCPRCYAAVADSDNISTAMILWNKQVRKQLGKI